MVDINKQIEDINKSVSSLNESTDSSLNELSPITSDSLQSEPDIKLPKSEPTTPVTDGLEGTIESGVDASTDKFTKALDERAKTAEENKDTVLEEYMQSLLAPGETETRVAAEKKAGLPETEQELLDINQQIREEQRALQNQVRRIEEKGGGLQRGAAAEVQNLRSESLRRQADLYVIQQGVQGKYDSAKAIADRAVSAYMEAQRNRQNVLGLIYQDNKELFNKSEQRAYESRLASRNRALDKEEERLNEIQNAALSMQEGGAPTSIVRQVLSLKDNPEATFTDAFAIGGNYIGAYDRQLKQLQISNIQSQITERVTPTGKTLTSAQASALGYAERLLDSSSVIDEIGKDFIGAGSIVGGFLPNMLKTSERQKFEQAQRNFINAVLRRESGAAIAPSEFENARLQYFPQPGDSQEVLIQKKQNRDRVSANFLREGGQDASLQEASLQDPLQIGITNNTANPLGI